MITRFVCIAVLATISSSYTAAAAHAGAPPITFEDVHGPCGNLDLVAGPTPFSVVGVHFATPDVFTYSVGQDYSAPAGLGNPFTSDSFHIWTFGAGAVLTFPGPITSLGFDAGVFVDQVTFPTFEVLVGGSVVATFGANISTLTPVSVTLAAPTTQVTLRFLAGSSSLLSNDDLEYTRDTAIGYCFGDGTATPCPCANTGAPGHGCANSVVPQGGQLLSSGAAVLSADTWVLHASGMPNSSALYFQGTAQENGGNGTLFGDGVRCVGGTIVRLGTKNNVAGASQYPEPGNLSISVKGGVTTAGLRTYQVWYRNSAPFCTPSTFNLTNGWQVTWIP